MHAPANTAASQGGISLARIEALRTAEAKLFRKARPKSKKAMAEGAEAYLAGVPMHWMRDWPMPFPFVVEKASGATITDMDGHELDDFCLGDTGSMFGHSPAPVASAIRRQARRGLTYMLPSEDALHLGRLLAEKFGLARWQIATTATDANRFALRVARAVTGRPKILVFNGCYHGSVDETMVRIANGRPANRPGLAGEFRDLTQATRIVEFNDIEALEAALAEGDVACVIAEPVLTNSCMVLPVPGFHAALREATRRHGTLLLIDETHTISTGPGGYTRAHGLEPDLFVLGKPVAGGVPASVWGMSEEVAARYAAYEQRKEPGYSGMGTTLSANPLQFAAMRATLEKVMTPENYAHMERLAARLEKGLSRAIDRHGLPWHVARVGARVEFICAPGPLANGAEAEAAHAPALEAAIHVALVNRGCLIAPFHNMMLVSPATRKKQVDRLTSAFDEIAGDLAGRPEGGAK
ncbi:aspartate aminotransferase family protein [Aquamicrobium sp. LC103]|uniref:aspartate aminotransferase family protein n=1 Tax=Aquamicrobium sp. LC103 TaxID=1120658 RepID=UPI00063E9C1C|nr:aspartate aminotransferase family protein [Aquamicrobium sp. LC103]TKT77612.1 aspartate aminotransferase family protein [Aquamicrobium sp. LC103]